MKWLFFTILLLIITGFIIFFYIRSKIRLYTKSIFNIDSLKDIIDQNEILESETPKSISSMENVLKGKIKNDFPDLNLNEIKRMSETVIMDVFNAINDGEPLEKYSDKIKISVQRKIKENKGVHFESIKFHKTTVKDYERKSDVATMYIASSLEYYKVENETRKKIQDRFVVEFIYIIDVSKYGDNNKAIGLNCPNCGASIKSVGHISCIYCGTSIKGIVKKNWSANNISRY